MNRHFLLQWAISALLLSGPAMGSIILTNGNFSTADTSADGVGWSAGPSNPTMFAIAGGVNGVANGPVGNNLASLYQTFSDSAMSTVNISFDLILAGAANGATPRQMDFRTLLGVTTANNTYFRFAIVGDGSIDFLNEAGAFTNTTTTGTVFNANVADTYSITLQLTGLDGAGGATGTMNGTITRASDNASYGFSGTNANWEAIDSMEFQNGSNWGTTHNSDFDNVVVAVPEPGVALLGGLGVLALLRRRRN